MHAVEPYVSTIAVHPMIGFNLLLVEDDEAARRDLAGSLSLRQHRVVEVERARDALAAIGTRDFDAVIMDRMLPDGDATVHLAQWRAKGVLLPILLLTGLAEVGNRIDGLDAGADDYLVKPASIGEIEARLRALIRRSVRQPMPSTTLAFGDLRIDRLKREVWLGKQRIYLQPREMRILEELALARGDVVPRLTLLKSIWNLQFDPKTKLLETHVSRLRDKLEDGTGVKLIETVRGAGYRLNTGA